MAGLFDFAAGALSFGESQQAGKQARETASGLESSASTIDPWGAGGRTAASDILAELYGGRRTGQLSQEELDRYKGVVEHVDSTLKRDPRLSLANFGPAIAQAYKIAKKKLSEHEAVPERRSTQEILASLPGYSAGLNLAERSVRRQAAGRGKRFSGELLSTLQRTGEAYAGETIDRLANLAGVNQGQAASSGLLSSAANIRAGAPTKLSGIGDLLSGAKSLFD